MTTPSTSSSQPSLLGPLTTTFTPPSSCSIPVINQASEYPFVAWRAQTCFGGTTVEDATSCWPPVSAPIAVSSQKLVLDGWGYYSPGLVCPVGYMAACSAIASATSNFDFQFPPSEMETATGCCPIGFVCTYDDTSPSYQTCVSMATSTTFQGALCEDATSMSVEVTVPAGTLDIVTSTVSVYAPMIQLVFQSSDQPASTPSSSSFPASRTSDRGISGAAIAGIVVGCIAGLGLVIVVTWLILYSRKRRQRKDRDGNGTWDKPEPPGVGIQKAELSGECISELPGQGIPREIQGTPMQEVDSSTEVRDTGL